MANPSYFQIAPRSQEIQHKVLAFHLYMHHQHVQGAANGNQQVKTNPNDRAIYDGLGPKANVVARAQDWSVCHDIVFIDERFRGSTVKVVGSFDAEEGECAIVGGTGELSCAQGVVTYKRIQDLGTTTGDIWELHIRALCFALPKPVIPATKFGPWGGDGGTVSDIPEPPQRLETLTIRSGHVIDSIAFSYVDQAGQKRTAGPWGGGGGYPHTIPDSPSEIFKTVSGTTDNFEGCTTITSLTFVTNVKTYGPYGFEEGTPFSVPVKDDNNIVGFFACARKYVYALGVYARPSVPK